MAWLRRRGVRERIKYFHRKARNITEDWAKKVSHTITSLAIQYQYAVAREDLTGLAENLRKLPKEHKVSLLTLSYRRLEHWIDWQYEKQGVPVITVNPRGTSSMCPKCGSKLVENNPRNLKCPK
jgi:putative transposase